MKPERIWLASAPPGKVQYMGPAVADTEEWAQHYRNMGWIVTGPYVLEEKR